MTAANSTAKTFYTYAHYRADQPERGPFYIGKGTAKRAWSTDGRSKWWKQTAEKHGLLVEILATWPSEEDAYSHERLIIECMRGMTLKIVNMTSGGDGLRDPDGSIRRKISKKVSDRWKEPEQRKRFTAHHRDPEVVARKSENLRAAFAKPESKKKRSESAKRHHAKPEVRARVIKNAADPEFRAKLSAGVKAASATPEAKAKRSAATRFAKIGAGKFRPLRPMPSA